MTTYDVDDYEGEMSKLMAEGIVHNYMRYPTYVIKNEKDENMILIKFKHEYGYVLYQIIPQHMSEKDLTMFDKAIKRICFVAREVMNYSVYNASEMVRMVEAQLSKIDVDSLECGKQFDIEIPLEDKATQNINHLIIGISTEKKVTE